MLLWYAAKRVRDGGCSTESAVQAACSIVVAGMSLGQAVPDVAQVAEGRRAAARLQAVLKRAPPPGALDAGAALHKPLLVCWRRSLLAAVPACICGRGPGRGLMPRQSGRGCTHAAIRTSRRPFPSCSAVESQSHTY